MRVLSPNAVIAFVAPVLLVLAACGGSDSPTTTPAIARVTVSAPSPALSVGQFTTLSAAAYGATGLPITAAGVAVWSSSAPAVASVDQAGKVSGAKPGSVTITADIANVKGSLTIAVVRPDTIFTPGIAFSPNTLTVLAGATVIFALGFDGIGHDVRFAATSGAPSDIPVTTRQYVARVFAKAGSFSYICPTHPEMTGVITVQ